MSKIDSYDFGGEFAQTYKKICEGCGGTIEVSTQKDESPEYYTRIYVKCQTCHESNCFDLPVN